MTTTIDYYGIPIGRTRLSSFIQLKKDNPDAHIFRVEKVLFVTYSNTNSNNPSSVTNIFGVQYFIGYPVSDFGFSPESFKTSDKSDLQMWTLTMDPNNPDVCIQIDHYKKMK